MWKKCSRIEKKYKRGLLHNSHFTLAYEENDSSIEIPAPFRMDPSVCKFN